MLLLKFLKWEEATLDEYRECFLAFGGNFSTNPEVLNYMHERLQCREKYYVHTSSAKINGAVCVWQDKYLANDISTINLTEGTGLPVAKDELILPLTTNKRIYVPWKSKIVSSINNKITNKSELFNARRTICLAKKPQDFSKKTIQTRSRELKNFLSHGGSVIDQSAFSPEELAEIYDQLFKMRWSSPLANAEVMKEFYEKFRDNIFGKILFFNNKPCAFQLITRCVSKNITSLDFIVSGSDRQIEKFSCGSILIWLNIMAAFSDPESKDKQIRFSFGRPTEDYKNRWCYEERVGKLL